MRLDKGWKDVACVVRRLLCTVLTTFLPLAHRSAMLNKLGQVLTPTSVLFAKKGAGNLNLTGSAQSGGGGSTMFNKEFDFVSLGIGGLDEQFNYIFRRAFASRIWPSHVVKSMGINHCRGMLLYGPPGCGKTLIARQIGKALNSHPPKIVNGPEILDKYVGGSEEKIRALFADAEKEQQAQGGESEGSKEWDKGAAVIHHRARSL